MFIIVYFNILQQINYYKKLYEIDQQEAARVRALGCPYCGSVLDSANFPRKCRGIPNEAEKHLECRFSFCCRKCRKRVTPASLRFLGRKVYLGAIVLLTSMLRSGRSGNAARSLSAKFQMSEVTLRRWVSWLEQKLKSSTWWQTQGHRLQLGAQDNDSLAFQLSREFLQDTRNVRDNLQRLLQFASPLSIPSQYPS